MFNDPCVGVFGLVLCLFAIVVWGTVYENTRNKAEANVATLATVLIFGSFFYGLHAALLYGLHVAVA